uniref:Uncharacterized protein n=1 Tax=uncultured prokaryote TaxID=198431 RepID=A0A0H5Q5N3_9ZZZZ|nr:hypothetical protein [uncultured prokaryote]
MVSNERSFTNRDTPESVPGTDQERCVVVHMLYPRIDLVCGKHGNMPCVAELLDKADSILRRLRRM